MLSFFKYLNSPELVVQFQQSCGIYSISKNDTIDQNSKLHSKNISIKTLITNGQIKSDTTTSSYVTSNGVKINGTIKHRKCQSAEFTLSESDEEPVFDDEYVATKWWLDWIFHFGASLGHEIFFITFFPYWLWNIDGYVGRRLCVFWCAFMYAGQACKDIVRWPRPSAPPVVRIEKRYALEYGMPSTHAMLGAGIPFTILLLTKDRYVYTFEYGVCLAVVWCGVVCLSRLYLGMHSVLDVLAGLVFIFALMPVCLPYLDCIDYFLLHSNYAPYVAICLPLTMALMYPTLDKWSPARGDTTLILGVGCGMTLGHWISFQYGFMQKTKVPGPYEILWPDRTWFGLMFLRLIIGVTILIATRAVVKTTVKRLLQVAFPFRSDTSIYRELPLKFVTYTAIALNAVCLAPMVFTYMNIERATYFTEL